MVRCSGYTSLQLYVYGHQWKLMPRCPWCFMVINGVNRSYNDHLGVTTFRHAGVYILFGNKPSFNVLRCILYTALRPPSSPSIEIRTLLPVFH